MWFFSLCLIFHGVASFKPVHTSQRNLGRSLSAKKWDLHFRDGTTAQDFQAFDPLGLADNDASEKIGCDSLLSSSHKKENPFALSIVPMMGTFLIPITSSPQSAFAAGSLLAEGTMNPSNFNPVCPASDSFYRFLQGGTEAVVGREAFVEYGPLIAGGLLRIRLELCVVESFFNEAVGPFIRQNGLNWILPLHETVETFLAGTIFCLASTFILVGSTKILSVIVIYSDLFLGAPLRLIGGFAFDRARGKPVTLDVGFGPLKTRLVGPPDEEAKSDTNDAVIDFEKSSPVDLAAVVGSGAMKSLGEASKIVRDVVEGFDVFVGRYLVLLATAYIGIKFLHFKVFPDFPPI